MNAKQKLFKRYAAIIESNAVGPNDESGMSMPRSALMACASGMREAAIGHARYEALRTMNPREFTALWCESLAGERFDDMVDELVKAKNGS